jgi:hypothetical protein
LRRSIRNSRAASRRFSAAFCFGLFAFGGFVTSTVPGIVPRSPGVVVVGVVGVGVVVGGGAVSVEVALSAAPAGPAIAAAAAIAAADTVAAFVERPTSSSYTAIGAGKHAIAVNKVFSLLASKVRGRRT